MITQEQKQFYADNGYLHLRGVFTADEAAVFRAEAHDLMERISDRGYNSAAWKSGDQISMVKTQLKHCHNVQFESALFSRLICDPRITDVASTIMETPNIQLHHNKLFIKPPSKGAPFPMHQDHPFFPHEQHTMIAAIIHFDDAPEE
ncbi:MAG: phytanoyl-CoA dioxygenase family protein, partial [Chloroflexota bacterium]